MPGDLTGEDAFDRVLEAAMEARRDVRAAVEAKQAAEERERQTEQLRQRDRAEAMKLDLERQKALPKLSDLWTIADSIATMMSRDNQIPDAETLVKLRNAVNAASDYCDQIPF